MLSPLLLVLQQVLPEPLSVGGILAQRPGPGDWVGGGLPSPHGQKGLWTAAQDGPLSEVQEEHVGGRVEGAEGPVQVEEVPTVPAGEPSRQHRLEGLTVDDAAFHSAHPFLEILPSLLRHQVTDDEITSIGTLGQGAYDLLERPRLTHGE